MILDELPVPIVLAPLAGGPSTPELAAAVSEAGGLGFLAAGYLTAEALGERLRATRALTDRPVAVNLFAPVPGPAEPARYEAYVARLREWGAPRGVAPGEPRFSDDGFAAKLDVLLAADPVAAISFTFGCPAGAVVERVRAHGAEVWVTVTTPEEASAAVAAGADALVVQGSEAGGHRGGFTDGPDQPVYGLLALLQLVRAAVPDAPLVATGGIATGAGVAAALGAGARAAQLGSAFLLCPEAGTSPAHRDALRAGRRTALTRAFTGRTARGIRNAFMEAHEAYAPLAYPEVHYATAPLRQAAREAGDAEAINLWAGEAHALAREAPAGVVVRELAREAALPAGGG